MLDTNDAGLKAHALDMWANHIETGNVHLSSLDAANQDLKQKPLSLDQMKLVVRLRELALEQRE